MADTNLSIGVTSARAVTNKVTLSTGVTASVTLNFTQAAYYEYVESMQYAHGVTTTSTDANEYAFARRMLLSEMEQCVIRYRTYEALASVSTSDSGLS
jgi:hypothetical protein